jgi:hypothetical protein
MECALVGWFVVSRLGFSSVLSVRYSSVSHLQMELMLVLSCRDSTELFIS